MKLTIELPEDLGAALQAKAQERGVSPAEWTRHLLQEAIQLEHTQKPKPKKSGYGLLAKYGPGPTDEDIEENRREMFGGFAQDAH
jgi:hypothetical protein